jgi:hypothetical protein
MGWTNRGSDRNVPRQDRPPEKFYDEKVPANPACAAWDEPGYEDPDAAHADLPLGARYWQGFAKKAPQIFERAMSPEWVAHVTENEGGEFPPWSEGEDVLHDRVIREKETERLTWRPASFLPG